MKFLEGMKQYYIGVIGFLAGTAMMLAVDQCAWDDGIVETEYGVDEYMNCFARSMSNTLTYIPEGKCPIKKKR